MPTKDAPTDVTEFLASQHREIERLLDQINATTGDEQVEAFECFVRLMAAHETAEEMVTHPLTRQAKGGDEVGEARLSEESKAKQKLAEIEKTKVGSPEFVQLMATFSEAVRAHANHEEREEFPILRRSNDAVERERLERVVEAVEHIAPTHPHPHGPDGALGNLVTGPFVAIADRVRDAVTNAAN